ncbi:hypothetical protein [Paenibacillus hamazuiensis]|uniref:hypothetical protein n=1 Tax=Paenibacillus hamazuiensis TaxID=2936508 RepID=UPI00200E1843|nr:hypothetical protein [Paenibacillus hamazuiensis]
MQTQNQLLIKHAVGGRTFIDSKKDPVPYSVEASPEGWMFTVQTTWNDDVREIIRLKDELNVFIFEETERGTKKTWYYVKDGRVSYDGTSGKLTLFAGSRIEYFPGDYSFY